MSILAIILSVVALFIIGFVWYGPLFGKAWMKANNIPEDADKNMKVSSFAISIFGSVVMVVAFYLWLSMVGVFNFRGVCTAAIIGLAAFTLPSLFDAVAWKNVSWKGFLIDGVYRFIEFLIVGALYLFL